MRFVHRPDLFRGTLSAPPDFAARTRWNRNSYSSRLRMLPNDSLVHLRTRAHWPGHSREFLYRQGQLHWQPLLSLIALRDSSLPPRRRISGSDLPPVSCALKGVIPRVRLLQTSIGEKSPNPHLGTSSLLVPESKTHRHDLLSVKFRGLLWANGDARDLRIWGGLQRTFDITCLPCTELLRFLPLPPWSSRSCRRLPSHIPVRIDL